MVAEPPGSQRWKLLPPLPLPGAQQDGGLNEKMWETYGNNMGKNMGKNMGNMETIWKRWKKYGNISKKQYGKRWEHNEETQ